MARLGRYELIEELGRGGMGVVWKAVDPAINRTVAIKVIPLKSPDGGGDPRQVKERVLREARAAGALSAHPGIVHVHDMGLEGDFAYVVMEYVEGTALDKWIQAGSPAGREAQFLQILGDAGVALDYAHKNGVIHRDVKPSNLIIQKDGAVKIMDFGIAKVSGSQTLTKTNMMLGSPFYMTPEQVLGQPVSGKTDQYSLGVIAYMMFAGRRPFEGGSFLDLFTKIVQEAPPEIPGAKPEVNASIQRAMAKDPLERFATCVEFIQALRGGYAPKAIPPTQPASGRSSGPSKPWISWAVAGVLAVLLMAAVGILVHQHLTSQMEMSFWESISDKRDPALYESYLQQYPQGKFASIARDQTAKLRTPPPKPPVVKQQEKKGTVIHGGLEPAERIDAVNPEYPALARQQHVQGTVKFAARIGVNGRVVALDLVSGPPLLVDAATTAVRKWRYKPGRLNGKPIETITNIELNFTLN